jgi:hypothetical protein
MCDGEQMSSRADLKKPEVKLPSSWPRIDQRIDRLFDRARFGLRSLRMTEFYLAITGTRALLRA